MKVLSLLNREDRIICRLNGIEPDRCRDWSTAGKSKSLRITYQYTDCGMVPDSEFSISLVIVFRSGCRCSRIIGRFDHVKYLGSLDYTDYFGFRLLALPSYMPVGWWSTIVQFGYLSLRLHERWSRWITVSIVSVLGSLCLPGMKNLPHLQKRGIILPVP